MQFKFYRLLLYIVNYSCSYAIVAPTGFCPLRDKTQGGIHRSPRVYKSTGINWLVYQKKSRFVQFKPAVRFRVVAANGIGNEIVRRLPA